VRQVIRSDHAERDLDEILTYLAQYSIPAADRFAVELADWCRLLPSQPMLGRNRDDLHPGMRSVVIERYVMFFLSTATEIQVVRIIHGSRNITPDMFSP